MARVDPALAAARNAVRPVLAGLGPDDLVLVACSGGADSLALAASVAYEARRVGRSVRARGHAVRAGAVVVDHGLQDGSAEIAERAAGQCRSLGLDPVLVRAVDAGVRPRLRSTATVGAGGPEATARDARYAVLEAVAEQTGAALVLLGHTLDDQAEQVLLGLARGAGARSLAGMPRERGVFRRPFLGLRRAQTEAVCAASGLEFWTDPTNLLPDDAARTVRTSSARPDADASRRAGSGADAAARDRSDAGAAPRDRSDAEAALRGRSVASRSVHRWTDLDATDRPQSQNEAKDRSRGSFTPLRSQVRWRVLPVLERTLGPGVAEALARSADQLRDDADLLDVLAAELLERARAAATNAPPESPPSESRLPEPPPPATAKSGDREIAAAHGDALDIDVLTSAHPALRRRVLRLAALAAGCPATDTTTRHVDALDALVVSWSGQGPVHLPGGARALRACGSLFLRAAPSGTPDGTTGVRPPSTTQE